jgi:hypothetical protein
MRGYSFPLKPQRHRTTYLRDLKAHMRCGTNVWADGRCGTGIQPLAGPQPLEGCLFAPAYMGWIRWAKPFQSSYCTDYGMNGALSLRPLGSRGQYCLEIGRFCFLVHNGCVHVPKTGFAQ